MKKVQVLATYLERDLIEAGCDEAGRGCLAGPVVAAAVILPKDVEIVGLNDSKKLTASARERLVPQIQDKALSHAIGVVSVEEIDEINILNASFLAMHRAIAQLDRSPEHLLIDGNRFNPYPSIKHTCIIGGDGRYLSIAAASVLAKTHRDALMAELDEVYPQYNWKSNKGYPSAAHRKAIAEQGPCVHHRKTFKLLPDQLSLFKPH